MDIWLLFNVIEDLLRAITAYQHHLKEGSHGSCNTRTGQCYPWRTPFTIVMGLLLFTLLAILRHLDRSLEDESQQSHDDVNKDTASIFDNENLSCQVERGKHLRRSISHLKSPKQSSHPSQAGKGPMKYHTVPRDARKMLRRMRRVDDRDVQMTGEKGLLDCEALFWRRLPKSGPHASAKAVARLQDHAEAPGEPWVSLSWY